MINHLNIFKIEYYWYEGEHEETLLGKNVERADFEKDIIKAKKFAESLIGKEIKKGEYLGKGYSVQCLPEYYEQILWFLTEKLGYVECNYDEDITYYVDDSCDKKISITKSEKTIKQTELSRETIKAIEKAKERMKKGQFLTEEQARKRLDLQA